MSETQKKGIITRLFSRDSAAERSIQVTSKGEADLSRKTVGLDFGVTVNNDSALKNTAYYAGIRIIGENFASLPKSVKRWSDKGVVAAPEHRINRLLHKPNAYTNEFVFWSTLATWLKDWGNAYAIILRDPAGIPVELHQCRPGSVRVTIVNGKKYYGVSFVEPDLQYLSGTYSDENMLHFMEVSLDGLTGLNPIVYNTIALGKSLAQEKFASEFYRKGGNIRAVMETDGNLGDEKYKNFMKHFEMASANFNTPLLEYGVKYKQLDINPVVAQLLQSETMSIQDVCRILGIPPHMVAELSHATFSNIEHQTIQFVQYTLRPLAKRFEVELESKLFFDAERSKNSIDFNLDGLLRGDTAARATYYHNAILDGYLSRNEVRALEGYESREGLDDYLYPLNSAIVGKEEKQPE